MLVPVELPPADKQRRRLTRNRNMRHAPVMNSTHCQSDCQLSTDLDLTITHRQNVEDFGAINHGKVRKRRLLNLEARVTDRSWLAPLSQIGGDGPFFNGAINQAYRSRTHEFFWWLR